MQILTIDWDFFISVDTKTRNDLYPNNTLGTLDSTPDNSLWDSVDLSTTDFFSDDYSKICSALKLAKFNFDTAFLSENHGEMYRIAHKLGVENISKITNIDFHHDLYVGCSHEPCCDNWGTLLLEENPNIKIDWLCRPDSNKYSFGNPVNAHQIGLREVLYDIEYGKFDYVHLCRSDLYSPPKYDKKFYEMWKLIKSRSYSEIVGHLENRGGLCLI